MNDKIVGVVLVFRDVTDERRHEQERECLLAAEQAARSEAESANRAKDRFLAVLSHELRTPLTPVLIAASSLLEQGDRSLDPSVRSVLEMVQRNVELESRLIDDLLDVSRIARGRLVLDLKTVDVHLAIRDCVEICRDETSAARLEVVLDLAARDHHVEGDHARLMQVVWNLVRNAARFAPGGGTLYDPHEQRARARRPPGSGHGWLPARSRCLIVEFTDTGIGIDPAIHDRIFEPFYQGDADVRRRPAGLGLGLAISRSIAEAHGGRLSLQSSGPGQGSTLPASSSHRARRRDDSARTDRARRQSRPAVPALKVLLVEDNHETLRYLTVILQKRNYNVVPVDRLSAAFAAAEQAQFDLLISDIELPDGTGLELIHGLGGGRTLPGIAISGFGSDEDLRQSADAGFAEHLTKPIDLNRLESAIRRVTSSEATNNRPGDSASSGGNLS